MWPFSRRSVVPVLRFNGPIGMVTPLRPGLTLAAYAGAIEKAFSLSKLPAVAVVVNSPAARRPVEPAFQAHPAAGGREGEARLRLLRRRRGVGRIFPRDRRRRNLRRPVFHHRFDRSCVAQLRICRYDRKTGIERRVYTAGTNKNQLDPFLPESPDDVARLKSIQQDVHDVFIGLVKERRLGKLKAADAELFSGAFWSATKAAELGLIDGITDLRSKMLQIFGDKVRLRVVPADRPGLLGRLRRFGSTGFDEPALHLLMIWCRLSKRGRSGLASVCNPSRRGLLCPRSYSSRLWPPSALRATGFGQAPGQRRNIAPQGHQPGASCR